MNSPTSSEVAIARQGVIAIERRCGVTVDYCQWASETSGMCLPVIIGRIRRPLVGHLFSPGLTRGVELRPKGLILLARSTRSYDCNTASGGFLHASLKQAAVDDICSIISACTKIPKYNLTKCLFVILYNPIGSR